MKTKSALDLRQGREYKALLRFSLPIILSYLLQQIYTLSDAVICGQTLSSNEIAGVNDIAPLTFLFLQFAFGCTAGFGVLTSYFVGQKNETETRRSFATQILLGAAVSVILTLTAIFTLNPLLSFIGVTPANYEVHKAAYEYCFVLFLGITAQLMYNLICSVLRSVGDSVTPLWFLVVSTVLNVALDLLFIIVFKWGVIGAAAATVAAQAVSAIGCFIYTFRKYPMLKVKLSDFKPDLKFWGRHLRQGFPLGLQSSILAIGLIVMQNKIVAFDTDSLGQMVAGTPAQNGYGAACKLNNFLMCPFMAFGTAVVSFNAQNLGAGEYDRIRRGTTQSMIIIAVMYVVFAGLGLLLTINGAYQHIFLSKDKISAESIKFGNLYMYVSLPCFIFLGLLFIWRNGDQGIGKPGYTLGAGIAELIARIVVCLILPTLINGGAISVSASSAAFVALSFADPIAWLCADIILIIPVIRCVYGKKY